MVLCLISVVVLAGAIVFVLFASAPEDGTNPRASKSANESPSDGGAYVVDEAVCGDIDWSGASEVFKLSNDTWIDDAKKADNFEYFGPSSELETGVIGCEVMLPIASKRDGERSDLGISATSYVQSETANLVYSNAVEVLDDDFIRERIEVDAPNQCDESVSVVKIDREQPDDLEIWCYVDNLVVSAGVTGLADRSSKLVDAKEAAARVLIPMISDVLEVLRKS